MVEKWNCPITAPYVSCWDILHMRPPTLTKTSTEHLRPLQQRSLTVAPLSLLLSSFERGYKTFFLNFLRNMTTSSCAGSEVSCKP